MARPTFLYYLFSENNRALYVGANGKIYEADANMNRLDNGQQANLEYSPIGWKEALVKYGRNLKYWGMFRDMTVPMTFPGDGFDILVDRIRKHGGYEALVSLGMLKLDRTALPYTYRSWFLSELNCVKAQQFLDSIKIEALEGGLSKFLKANENTKYTIPIDDDPGHITIYNDGMELLNSGTWAVTDGIPTPGDSSYYIGNHIMDCYLVNKEIQDIGGLYTVSRTKMKNGDVGKNQAYSIFIATTDGAIDVEYDFILNVTLTPGNALSSGIILRTLLRRIDKNGSPYFNDPTGANIILQRNGGSFPNQNIPGTYHVKGTIHIPVKSGDQIYPYTFVDVEGATGDKILAFSYGGDEPHMSMKYTYRHPASYVNGHLPTRLAQLLLDAMTGTTGVYKIQSNFLTWLENNFILAFVSGDSLRGLSGATLQSSFFSFFKSLNSRFGIGLGIKGGDTLIIEKWEDLFDDTDVIFDLGEVDFTSVDVAEDLLFNTIKNGYSKQDYEEINGRSEINQGQQWQAPPLRVSKEFDLTSDYRADAFGAELMRINFGNKKTTDSSSDNDTWMLHVKKSTIAPPRFEAHSKIATDYPLGIGDIKFATYAGAKVIQPNADQWQFTYTGSASMMMKLTASVVPKKADNGLSRLRIYRNAEVLAEVTGLSNGAFQMTATGQAIINPGDALRAEIFYINGSQSITVNFADLYIDLVGTSIYELNRPPYSTITGVLAPNSIYNMELSPKRGILANGSLIRSCLEQMDSKFIKLTAADKNTDVTTILNGVTITENANIPIGSLTAPKFLPSYILFKTKSPIDLLEVMDVRPYGKIKFTVNGKIYYGWLFDGGLRPGDMDAQNWKVLSHWSNDLSTLKKVA